MYIVEASVRYMVVIKSNCLFLQHHCRRCGQIFCGKCSSNKVQFHRMGFVDPVRLCKPCSDITKKEEEFFNNDLKLLLTGTFTLTMQQIIITSQTNWRFSACRCSHESVQDPTANHPTHRWRRGVLSSRIVDVGC